MSLEVLQSRHEIDAARAELRQRGVSSLTPWWLKFLRARGLAKGDNVGDLIKSWDIHRTLKFAENNVPKQAPVLDIGAYASEILCIMHKLGYTNLAGVDLNPNLKQMPYADSIRYEVSDFMATPFPDESFELITAISVIEHGFNGQRLLSEVCRLLKPGGYFVASFDYWPEKLDTTDIKMFDMDWKIFSEGEARKLLVDAEKYGLIPYGETRFAVSDRPVSCAGKDYTFAWLALRKQQ